MTTAGFGGEGPVVVPTFAPRLAEEDELMESGEVEDASATEIEEEAEVVAHLDDPEVDEAIKHLRATRD